MSAIPAIPGTSLGPNNISDLMRFAVISKAVHSAPTRLVTCELVFLAVLSVSETPERNLRTDESIGFGHETVDFECLAMTLCLLA